MTEWANERSISLSDRTTSLCSLIDWRIQDKSRVATCFSEFSIMSLYPSIFPFGRWGATQTTVNLEVVAFLTANLAIGPDSINKENKINQGPVL